MSASNPPAFGYTEFTYTAQATSSSTTVSAFSFQQNPSYFLLDNVSVVQAAVSALSHRRW